jgi:Ras GTPase-activating-like protein IQGAP2/3
MPGTFVISLHYKGLHPDEPALGVGCTGSMHELTMNLLLSGRNRGLLELDLKLDDLLEMQQNNHDELDLEYVQFNVPKVLALLNKRFARKGKW